MMAFDQALAGIAHIETIDLGEQRVEILAQRNADGSVTPGFDTEYRVFGLGNVLQGKAFLAVGAGDIEVGILSKEPLHALPESVESDLSEAALLNHAYQQNRAFFRLCQKIVENKPADWIFRLDTSDLPMHTFSLQLPDGTKVSCNSDTRWFGTDNAEKLILYTGPFTVEYLCPEDHGANETHFGDNPLDTDAACQRAATQLLAEIRNEYAPDVGAGAGAGEEEVAAVPPAPPPSPTGVADAAPGGGGDGAPVIGPAPEAVTPVAGVTTFGGGDDPHFSGESSSEDEPEPPVAKKRRTDGGDSDLEP